MADPPGGSDPTVYLVKLGRIVFAGAGLDGISALPAAVQKARSG